MFILACNCKQYNQGVNLLAFTNNNTLLQTFLWPQKTPSDNFSLCICRRKTHPLHLRGRCIRTLARRCCFMLSRAIMCVFLLMGRLEQGSHTQWWENRILGSKASYHKYVYADSVNESFCSPLECTKAMDSVYIWCLMFSYARFNYGLKKKKQKLCDKKTF